MSVRLRFLVLSFFILSCVLPGFVMGNQEQIQQLQQIQQTNQSPQQVLPLSNFDQEKSIIINSNASINPDFEKRPEPAGKTSLKTVKALVPYEDLYKVLQNDIGKYFILPIEEFEALKAAKEAWLASKTAPIADPPPLLYQIHSVQLEGKIEENFAHIRGNFKIETFTDSWHQIPVMWGSLAVDDVKLNGNTTTLKTSWVDSRSRQVNFGRINQQAAFQNIISKIGSKNDILSQNNWKDTMFSLPIKGKGRHEAMISFIVPVQNLDDLFTLQFNITRIPLTFIRLIADKFILSIDSTTFKDFSVSELSSKSGGCEFIGWLGASSDITLKWRRKFARTVVVPEKPKIEDAAVDSPEPDRAPEIQEEEVPAVIFPLVYARSNTLVSLGETAIQVDKTFDFTISKAPVSSFTFDIPENAEILHVNSDRPHTHRLIRENGKKRLRIEFLAGREDTCQIDLSYETPVDLSLTYIGIPEVTPLNVERELGAVAIEALSSVEVQPGNNDEFPLAKGVYNLDPMEAPQPLKDRATRPILLAYRQSASPSKIRLSVKRYLDVAQQTVVADSMEVKTTFTTNQTSNSLISMNIRNNNKQYLQLQLASGSEVISAFRQGLPVKLVAGRNDGKVQIPLEMSQTVGEPVEMNIQVLLKQPVSQVKWRGKLSFEPPLVDIPVSRFSWFLYAPEDYRLFDFSGTVKDTLPQRDPFFFRGFTRVLKELWNFCTSPDAVITVFFLVMITMLIVSRKLLMSIIKVLWNCICSVFAFIFGGSGFRLVELMIVIGILAVLAAIATPNFRKSRSQARDKACQANQRVIQGAVEMYNMDNSPMMQNLNLQQLLKNRYIKAMPVGPEPGCRYSNRGNLGENGVIFCPIHGSIEDFAAPEQQELARENFSSKGKFSKPSVQSSMPVKQKTLKESRSDTDSFGAAKTKGMLPIKSKFVMTRNFYSLERDLVISDIASNGAIVANHTSPRVNVSYIHSTAVKAGEVIAFIMAIFAALYFVSGAYMGYKGKTLFAAILIIFLSILDMKFRSIGDSANIGFWLAIGGAVIWKISLLISWSWPSGDDETPPDQEAIRNYKKATPEPEAPSAPADSGKINLVFLLAISVFFLTALAFPAMADEIREIRIMAPFKELSKVIPTGDRVVIIPESDYQYLRDITDIPVKEIEAPQAFSFESVAYNGIIEERGVRFNGIFKIALLNSGWKKIGLLSPDAVPSYATINGSPLAMTLLDNRHSNAYGFFTNATGSVSVNVEFFIPMSSSEFRHTSRFTLNTLPICLSTMRVTVKEKDCEAWVDPGVLMIPERYEDQTTFVVTLPPTSSVNFELYRNVVSAPLTEAAAVAESSSTAEIEDKPIILEEKTRVTARQHNLLYFKEGFVSGFNHYDLSIKGGNGIASLSLALPPRIRVLKVENKLIEDWEVTENGNERKLIIAFKSNIRGNTELAIEFEEEVQHTRDENYQVPEIILENTERSFGILGIGCLQTLELSVNSPQGYSPIIAGEFLKDWKKEKPEKTPYAFKFLRHPNQMEVIISRPEDISQQTAVIDRAEAMTLLNEEGYLLTRVIYEVKNNSQQFLKIRLPHTEGAETELWSTQVAGISVRAGFDEEKKAYNLPIIRSQIVKGESQSFPVEMVYAVKTGKTMQAFNHIYLELPAAHLPISELSWILYLPEGYELMRETGNVDRRQQSAELRFLDNSSYFSSAKQITYGQKRQRSGQQKMPVRQADRVFNMAGLMPVKFKIPTTAWQTHFSMLQIEPSGKPPYVDGILVNPRKDRGFLFQLFMIATGIITSLCLVKLCFSPAKYLWFLVLTVQAAILAVSVYLKLYQADHFYQMGISTSLLLYLFFKLFQYKPAATEKGN